VGGGRGFGDVPNAVTILDADGEVVGRASGSKLAVAHAILDEVVARRARHEGVGGRG
jgi:phosphopantothenoylcysteine decarboxylase/phosphopantothenate--cysteine ligase